MIDIFGNEQCGRETSIQSSQVQTFSLLRGHDYGPLDDGGCRTV